MLNTYANLIVKLYFRKVFLFLQVGDIEKLKTQTNISYSKMNPQKYEQTNPDC